MNAPLFLLQIRDSGDADCAAIRAIYAHHVLHGTGSFEEIPPDQDEMARRRAELIDRGLPYLVAEIDQRVVGYAYAGPYRLRTAYRFTLENSVYIAPEWMGRRIGGALLGTLLQRCGALGYRQMIAVIDSANEASLRLHGSQGFTHAGVLRDVGFKHEKWLDTVLMQCTLESAGP